MKMTDAEWNFALEHKLLQPYEDELISKLRKVNYKGFPASLTVLCFEARNTACYTTAILLTRGMEHFKLVLGNVEPYPINGDGYPNHSWVENDDYVYDPTDGVKWRKDVYYKAYNAEAIEVYTEKTISNYSRYQEVLPALNEKEIPLNACAMIIQDMEMQELQNPTINHKELLAEIRVIRETKGITKRYSNEVMAQYRKFFEDEVESFENSKK